MTKLHFFILFAGTLLFSSCFNSDNNKLTILFDRVDHVEIGDKVLLNGFPIGEVTNLQLFGDSVLVNVKFNDEIKIPIDSKFIITPSLLGNSQINVEKSNKSTYLSSHDTVPGSYLKTGVFDNILSDSAKREKIKITVDKISDAIKEFVDSSGGKITNQK